MGFCFFNNVAVGAAHAMAEHGIERVAIIDFDVHHGNGTEDIFAGDERVLDLHQRRLRRPPRRRTRPDGLVEADYEWITRQLKAVADRHAGGRIVSCLEGGYCLSALARSVAAHLRVLADLD
jgi:acetoin utilization deacetylase AcuC-like enzyme